VEFAGIHYEAEILRESAESWGNIQAFLATLREYQPKGTKARSTVSNHSEAGTVPGGGENESGCQSGSWMFREDVEAALPMAEMAQPLMWGRDEAEVVTELQAGSEAAFEALITHYHAPVYNLLLQMLGNEADAADSSQEVFVKAFRGIKNFRRGSSLKTWLYRIAIREALNQRRWFSRHRRNESSLDGQGTGEHPALQIEELGPSPFDQLVAHQAQQVVHRALGAVAQVFRSAVILRDLEGLSYEEVAEVLDVSVGTVKSRILRGRRALRLVLETSLHGGAAEPASSSSGLAGELAGGGE
jgi:RNA polymerase sigma-70 factor (ECF subfamily)